MMDFIIKTLSRIDDSKVFSLICIDDVVLNSKQCLFECLLQCYCGNKPCHQETTKLDLEINIWMLIPIPFYSFLHLSTTSAHTL